MEEDFLAEFQTKWDSKISLALGPGMTGEAVTIKQKYQASYKIQGLFKDF